MLTRVQHRKHHHSLPSAAPVRNTKHVPCLGEKSHLLFEKAYSMGRMYVVVFRDAVFDFLHELVDAQTLVGRKDQCGLRLNHPFVSRTHALLTYYDNTLLIRDLKSRNGTRLNGDALTDERRFQESAGASIGPFTLLATRTRDADFAQAVTRDDSASTLGPSQQSHVIQVLTVAQSRVYQLLLEGLSEKEAAAKLDIAVCTLHDHVKAIYRTLGVSSRGELFAYSRDHANKLEETNSPMCVRGRQIRR